MKNITTIGHVAKQIGVSTDTIRLYERYGLIDQPQRTDSGYRYYRTEDIQRLLFIKKTKAMGFTLNEIRELLDIHKTSASSCSDVKLQAQVKLEHIAERISELKKLKGVIQDLIQDCEKHHPNDLCPLFVSLDKKRKK